MEIYIHIPFCKSKCQYCDFVSFKMGCDNIDEYINALIKEIELSSVEFKDRQIDTIFIGGGTPSILFVEQVSKIINALNKSYDLSHLKEFTIECNPESITEEKLIAYKNLGINRISIGVQSLLDKNLIEIGRVHNSKLAIEKINLAKRYFDNVSCDLIIGLPYDTIESVKYEVDTISKLVNHVSMYELIVEDGTILKKRIDRKEVTIPSDDFVQDLFNAAIKCVYENGFYRYEVSNFSKPSFKSIHNYGYWIRDEYLGLGLNSSSLIKGNEEIRFKNSTKFDEYLDTVNKANSFDEIAHEDIQTLDDEDVKKEEIILNLRTREGINVDKIKIPDKFENFFNVNNGMASLNDEGMAVMNSILIELI